MGIALPYVYVNNALCAPACGLNDTLQVRDFQHALLLIDTILSRAPAFQKGTDGNLSAGLVGFPINAIFDWSMGTQVRGVFIWLSLVLGGDSCCLMLSVSEILLSTRLACASFAGRLFCLLASQSERGIGCHPERVGFVPVIPGLLLRAQRRPCHWVVSGRGVLRE